MAKDTPWRKRVRLSGGIMWQKPRSLVVSPQLNLTLSIAPIASMVNVTPIV